MSKGRAQGKKKAGAAGIGTLLLVVVVYLVFGPEAFRDEPGVNRTNPIAERVESETARRGSNGVSERTDPVLRRAIEEEQSGVMVTFTAAVTRLLPDDNDGSRHQRFIMRLPERIGDVRTILVAHNIDLAKRVPLDEGDTVTVRGQYEWNEKGGVIHWTHHDPGGIREGGWIEHAGVRYE